MSEPVADNTADSSSGQTNAPPSPAHAVQEKPKSSKVEILLHPTGDTPIIKKKKWTLEPSKQVAFISDFVKKLIKCDPRDSLFLYVNQSFAPSPDTEVGTLYECFGSDGKLVFHYCKTQAWG